MYLCKTAEGYTLLSAPERRVIAQLLPPVIVENGVEQAVTEDFSWRDRLDSLGDGLFRVTRKVANLSEKRRRLQIINQVKTCFQPADYIIPCVMYNGNEWGGRNSPKGLTRDGQPWVFAYDRTGIPSCTLTENADFGFALFASARDKESLRTGCSIVRDGQEFIHRIHYPVVEAPVSYSGKNKMTGRYDEYIDLAPGAQFAMTFHLWACEPMWEHYATANLLNRMPEVFPYTHEPIFTPKRVWELGIAYLTRLIHDYEGRTLIIAGFDTKLSRLQAGHAGAKMTKEEMLHLLSLPEYNTYGFNREIYEIGWAGQEFLSTRMLLKDAFAKGDGAKVDLLIGSLHNWTEKQLENGMVLPHFERYKTYEAVLAAGDKEKLDDPCQGYLPDACNLGWGASEMSKIYMLLRSKGREHSEFLQFATRICDFFIDHFDEKVGYGKTWTLSGQPVDGTGTVGGFMITGLIDTWKVTGNPRYLESAKHAMEFYYTRDLDKFLCTAGAIDCQSVDKETSYPFVVASLDLYEITQEPIWLERALKAAYYFFSWAFQYDAIYPDSSDFARFGYYTSGGTAISAEHHAIDPWGALLCAEFVRLAKMTGDSNWIIRSRMMWVNSLYGITANEGDVVHGLARPLGSQNEGFFQARWTKYRPDCEERGHFNDWLVAWVTCWRLTALDRLTTVAGEDDWSLFA